MSLFKRDRAEFPVPAEAQEVLEPVYQPTTSPAAARPSTPSDIETAKDAIEAITGELKIGADQQQVAAKRMAGLAKTIEKMEAGLRHMGRLETQAAKYENDFIELQKRYILKENWAGEQERKLANLEALHSQLRQDFELAQGDILARTDRETRHVEQLGSQGAQIDGLNAVLSERDDRINTLTMTNTNLQEDVSAQSVALSQQGNRIVELQKSLEEISMRLDTKTKQNDQLMSELGNLRLDHNELKSQYFEKLAALEHAQYDLKTQRTVLDEGMKRRDEESYALKTRIEQLNAQVRIKENMSGHLDEEIISLRAAIDGERARNERTERRLREKTQEADSASSALRSTKADYDALSAKFDATAHDLDAARRINHIQKQKLERYASIAALNASTPDTTVSSGGLIGGTGRRDSYLADYDGPAVETKAADNTGKAEVPIRDIQGRKKI